MGGQELLWGPTLHHVDDVGPLFGGEGLPGMPDVFTPFRHKVRLTLCSAPCGASKAVLCTLGMTRCESCICRPSSRWYMPRIA